MDLSDSDDTPNVTPLVVGRGRGFTTVPFSLGDCRVGHRAADSSCELVAESQSVQCTKSSTSDPPITDVSLVDQMSDIVQQIGQRLADSILSHLTTPHTSSPASATYTCPEVAHETTDLPSSRSLDLSQVQLVAPRQVKDPPVFRGESSDSLSVDEWQEAMQSYIKKSAILPENQAEEILMHLRGRAKDVVKFGVRNGGIDVQHNPQAIYRLLHKHFSSTQCSSVPLADFYSTLPKDREDPYEYWLRLNKAADVVGNCLKEQGKSFENSGVEVARMFIRHCPCRDLALIFRTKTCDKWSAREVQEVLDEYHLGKGFQSPPQTGNCVYVNKAEVSTNGTPCLADHEQRPAVSQDGSAIERLISMLEKMLLQGPGYARANARRQSARLPRIPGLDDTPCSICRDSSHSTLTHCRENRLCFMCHLPGHSRRNCPEGKCTPSSGHQGN